MKLELEGLLKEAFGVDQAKASDLSNPNTPYTFSNTLEWAVGVQPKKEPNQLTEGTPLAKSIPQISSAPEAPLEEPLINPFDIIFQFAVVERAGTHPVRGRSATISR